MVGLPPWRLEVDRRGSPGGVVASCKEAVSRSAVRWAEEGADAEERDGGEAEGDLALDGVVFVVFFFGEETLLFFFFGFGKDDRFCSGALFLLLLFPPPAPLAYVLPFEDVAVCGEDGTLER